MMILIKIFMTFSRANSIKIFHFARFDVAVLFEHLNVWCEPVYCTKLASKIARTYTDRHGLKDLCRELLGKDLSKTQQSSDWGAEKLRDDITCLAINLKNIELVKPIKKKREENKTDG